MIRPTQSIFVRRSIRWSAWMLSLVLLSCQGPGGRSWIIPVTVDPSDLQVAPADLPEFAVRRGELAESLDSGYVFLYSTDEQSQNRHEFRANNNFFYLTGWNVPETWAVLDLKHNTLTLTRREPNIRRMIYEGDQAPASLLRERYGADRVLEFDEFREYLDSLLQTGAPCSTIRPIPWPTGFWRTDPTDETAAGSPIAGPGWMK
ncbi:MAG: aminopeptidase P N-terminal domain-containing protein [Bacteroidales bacterium]